MKLSIAWIFDHIDEHWTNCDIEQLIARFNQTTAEIEDYYIYDIQLDNFYIASQKSLTSSTLFIPELSKEITLAPRKNPTDLISVGATDIRFMVKRVGDSFEWARLSDFGGEKDGLIPALDIENSDLSGGWRKKFESKDVIIEVDNKSITHRPDMWGHRGFAREIAAMLNLKFKASKTFLAHYPVKIFDAMTKASSSNPYVIENRVDTRCPKYNGLYFNSIENKFSNIFIMSRLLKVGSRPINGLVDLTNYVTLDWSQPVHAYDAEKIVDKKVIIRTATKGEKLMLLDGTELEMTPEDMVIADGKKPICLAGVKGGMYDSVSTETRSIFFESATFDAATVRRSAFRHKTRTDSSARFEKTLDPNQAVEALFRFIKLLDQCGIAARYADDIIAVGKDSIAPVITVEHDFIQKRIGVPLQQEDVINALAPLEFGIEVRNNVYAITVPTFRSSKDIKIKEDIVEEVARRYGFVNIGLNIPRIVRAPFDLTSHNRKRKISKFFAYSAHMMEQQNYSFFDEGYLRELGIQQHAVTALLNPVSENYARLISSLIPGLLKNIKENVTHNDSIRFFEAGRIWLEDGSHIQEQKAYAGIFFEKRRPVDFYEMKYLLSRLFVELGFDSTHLEWRKVEHPPQLWYKPFQTAEIIYKHRSVGFMGKIEPLFLTKFNVLPESDASIFELNGEFLLEATAEVKKYAPLSRFQETFFDLSLLVPITTQAMDVQNRLTTLSDMIEKAELIDFFEHERWQGKRSLTFRVWLGSKEKTLEKEEVEALRQKAIEAMRSRGAELRA